MKTVESVRNRMSELVKEFPGGVAAHKGGLREKEAKAAGKEYNFLKACMTYLELGPTEQFLKSEKDRLTTEIDKASDGFSTWRGSWDGVQWYQKHSGSNGLTYYLGQCDVPKKQKQIKAIDFLLSNP